MITVRVDPALKKFVDQEDLSRAGTQALVYCGVDASSGMAIAVTGDARLRKLNREFLGEDRPTDVLSFASGETDPEDGSTYLGDVVISYPRAQIQAQAGGHPVFEEMRLLVVHGTLHLLGYDHSDREEKARMWSAQSEILSLLGSAITSPPAYLEE